VDLDKSVAAPDRIVHDLEQDVRVNLPAVLAYSDVLVEDELCAVDEEDRLLTGVGGASAQEREVFAGAREEVLVHPEMDLLGHTDNGH
jgi:hypothetical protein